MNQEQFLSLIRAVLLIIGTVLVAFRAFGLTDATWEPIAGGLLAIAPILWSMRVHTQSNAIAVVAAMPSTEVSSTGKSITITDPKLQEVAKANATPAKV